MIQWLRDMLAPAAPPQMQMIRSERPYEAASKSAANFGWGCSNLGPTAANVQDSETLRARSRDAWRNQPLAVRGMDLLVGRMLGEQGMNPRFSAIDDPGLAAAARDLWRDWAELCDHTGTLGLIGVQFQMLHALYTDGGALLRFWLAGEPGEIPLTLQPMELDYLSELTLGGRIQGGIETNGRGRVVAYHLSREHPGEMGWWFRNSTQIDRIEAREIAHLHLSHRPGQLYGVPAAHAALAPMRYLDDLGDADLVRLRAQATLAAVITGASAPVGDSVERPGGFGTVMRDAAGNTVETLTPGSIHYTDADSVTLTRPSSDPSVNATATQWQHLIAVAMGVQYHDLVGDLSAINYSSYRAGHITDRQNTLIQRAAFIYPRLLTPLWRNWRLASGAIDGGMRKLPRRLEWTAPKWHSVDPHKDAQADVERIRAGLDSLTRAIEHTGADPTEVFASLAKDKKTLDDLGLIVSTITATNSAAEG